LTTNGTLLGQWQFGQNPEMTGFKPFDPVVHPTLGSGFSSLPNGTPKTSANLLTVSSESFVGCPPSNIESADCVQPTCAASSV
jgi:hypothetical protein